MGHFGRVQERLRLFPCTGVSGGELFTSTTTEENPPEKKGPKRNVNPEELVQTVSETRFMSPEILICVLTGFY